MAKKMNVLQKIDNGILQVKELQRKVEQNTIIEEKAIQLISECRFKEAMKLLEGRLFPKSIIKTKLVLATCKNVVPQKQKG